MEVNFSNPNSRLTQKTGSNGLSKATASIPTSSSITILEKNSKAKISNSIGQSRRSRKNSRRNATSFHRPHPFQTETRGRAPKVGSDTEGAGANPAEIPVDERTDGPGVLRIDPNDPAAPIYRLLKKMRSPLTLRDMMILPVRTGYISDKIDPADLPPSA